MHGEIFLECTKSSEKRRGNENKNWDQLDISVACVHHGASNGSKAIQWNCKWQCQVKDDKMRKRDSTKRNDTPNQTKYANNDCRMLTMEKRIQRGNEITVEWEREREKNYENFSSFKINGNDCRIDDTLCVFLISFRAGSLSWATQFERNKFYFAWNVPLNNNTYHIQTLKYLPMMRLLKLWKHTTDLTLMIPTTPLATKSRFSLSVLNVIVLAFVHLILFFRVCSKCSTYFVLM